MDQPICTTAIELLVQLEAARSKIPSPPSLFGLHSRRQLTQHVTAFGSLLPDQRKLRLILSMHLIAHLERQKDVI